ncbi:LysR family transcriptional regulator [Herbaspirillum camelliae]|uniref:LysR family transcriptional regulator n=1 Tax=Herbaspirillum camelliae TaxID=1892903 RepID=UPI00094A043B|nr:LysR family transcriptional regulator [Herbaspirillum camelliae]
MDKYQELSAFVAVVEAGGFSAAARRIGDSQSSVSKAVGALESRLGVRLFNRSTRSVSLTDHGRKYYERTKPLLEEMDQVDGELMNSAREISGLVRIATSSTFGRLHVLPLVPDLLSRYPRLQLDLHLTDGVRDLLADGVDLAIRISPARHPDAIVKRVATTSLVCVGARSYFELHGIPTSPGDLVHHNCLIYNNMTEWPFTGPQGPFSVPVSGNMASNTLEAILLGVRSGVGIGMFNSASLVGELRHPNIMPILEAFITEARDISLVWPRRRFIPERLRVVTEFFAEQLAARI